MKKTSSIVWRFFDRLEENKRCVAVLCKLCDHQYKFFGNTTNLRTHLLNKHPIQWDLLQNGTLDESTFQAFDDDDSTNQSASASKRKRYDKGYKDENVRYSVSVDLNKKRDVRDSSAVNSMPVIEIQRAEALENSETDNEHTTEVTEEPINIVRQMHGSRASDEEWLNEEIIETIDYQPKHTNMNYRTIKREIKTPPLSTPKYRILQNPVSNARTERVIFDSRLKKDEFSVFGEYVGNRLRKFKNSQVRGNVQQLITTIMWQAEYGMYDNIETVKRVLLHSVQEMEVVQTENVEHIVVQEAQIHKDVIEVEETN